MVVPHDRAAVRQPVDEPAQRIEIASGGYDREVRVRRVEETEQLCEGRGVAVDRELAAGHQILLLRGAGYEPVERGAADPDHRVARALRRSGPMPKHAV